MASKNLGGSLQNPIFRQSLRHYGILDAINQTRNKYREIARLLGIRPTRPNSNVLLKEGSPTYKKFIENEVIRRYNVYLDTIASQQITEQRKKMTTLSKEIKAKKIRPRVLHKNVIDAHGKFKLYNYELKDVSTLEELYTIIYKEMEKLGDLNFATLMFENITTGKVRGLSVKASYLTTYEDFENFVNSMIEGSIVGSDAFSENEYKLLFDNIHISTYSLPSVYGNSDYVLYNCVGIESKKGNCSIECFKHIGYEITGKNKTDFKYINNIIKYVKENNLPIKIICNSFLIKDKPFNIIKKNGQIRTEIENKKKKRNELKIVSRLLDEDIDIPFLIDPSLDGGKINHILIYDDINEHLDIATSLNPTLKNDVFLSMESEVIKNGKVIFSPKQIINNSFKKTTGSFEYIFFDYETIIDFNVSSCMKPYSLSILRLTETELEELEEADKDKNVKKVEEIRKKGCITFLGYDCNEKFINWFCAYQQNRTFCFVGFNNSNFDNFLLLDGLLRHDQHKHRVSFNVNGIFYNGSQLLNFTINGRHTLFDIHKHLSMGSLKSNCESFKINCCSKKEFHHSKAQFLHEENKLIDFINNDNELKEYNEFDVLATAVLFQRYRMALKEIPSTEKYAKNIKETITIGSLIYKVFKDHIKTFEKDLDDKEKEKGLFGKLNYRYYKDLQKCKIAGRVELFNGIQKINERMASTDVCSLYPFVMSVLDVYYPRGDIIEVEDYRGDDEIGFYYCDIDQSNLRQNNLPKIYAKKTDIENNWNHEEVLENYLISNVMIGLLRKYGCQVNIKNGFIFSRKEKSCDMFKFLLEMMKAKNEQDYLKSTKNPNYNGALRETYKLLMNSLSGKVIEGLHTEKTTDFDSEADFTKIMDKAKSINFINCIGNKLFATYELDEEKICEAQQRPIFLGVLIYDYAKRYMFENSYSKIGLEQLVYTDTDASKFRYSQMERWVNWIKENNIQVPHWKEVEDYDVRYKNHLIYQNDSKVFGSYEDELEEEIGDEYLFYCVEKKSWCYSVLHEPTNILDVGKYKSKFKFKGINGKALLLNLDEPFLEEHLIKSKKDGTMRIENKVKPDNEFEVYKWCEENKNRQIENDAVKFYDQIYNTGEAYVMTNSFRKIVKNSLHSVEMGDEEKYNGLLNKIQVNFMMKKIKVNLNRS